VSAEKAAQLRAWHREPRLLVIPNAWDVASARRFAALSGCRAIATTSAAVARSLGFEDGAAPGDEMLGAAARIAAAVDVPVTADLERGYDDPPATVAAAWAAGIVGANIEDSVGHAAPVPIDEQVELLRAVRAAAPELVLNARVDTFLGGSGDAADAIERGNAYLDAGADCVFPILASDRDDVAALVAGVRGPVALAVTRTLPPLAELERLGVARLTWGPGLATVALDAAAAVAAEALQTVT
jgi:2-methylisocitrate lyase-like PEP mutase family enzyme